MAEIDVFDTVFKKQVNKRSHLGISPYGWEVKKDLDRKLITHVIKSLLAELGGGLKTQPESSELAVYYFIKINLANRDLL